MLCSTAKEILMRRKITADAERATFKVPEAARVAGCGDRAIRNGIADGRIPHLKFGRNILIPKAAFFRWLDSCGQTGEGARP
jgi:excisionase family DNA binding protein